MSVLTQAIDAIKEAAETHRCGRRAGETLKDRPRRFATMTAALPAWRHNGKPLPCCRVSGWNDTVYSNPYFELGPDCPTVLNCGPSLAVAARRSEISYPVW